MNKVKNVISILFLAIFFAGCSKDVPMKSEDGVETEPIDLKGSQWKLAGIVDGQTGVLKKFEPAHCEECYTLWFDTDLTATSLSVGQRLKLDLSHFDPEELDPVIFNKILLCENYDRDGEDYCDSDAFFRAIGLTENYSETRDELKLFVYQKGGTYLSFRPYNGKFQLETSLRGTRWKLNGIVETQTGVLKELEPKDCDECYTFAFRGENIAISRSIWVRQELDLSNLDIEIDPTRPGGDEREKPLYAEEWPYDPSYWKGDGKTYDDSYLFRCGIAYTESYEINPDELKLYFVYLGKSYYLSFKCIYR